MMVKSRVTWRANEVSDLIALWGSPEFRDRIEVRNWKSSAGNQMAVFKEMAERLHRLGHPKKDGHHVQTKIKGLRASFKAVKDKMNKSGAGTDSLGDFEYFEEINNILGHRPNVNPSPLTIGDLSVSREVGLAGNRMPMPSGQRPRPASCNRISENENNASKDSVSPVDFLRRPGSSCGRSSGNSDDALPTFKGVPYSRGMIIGFEDWYAEDDAMESASLGTNSEGKYRLLKIYKLAEH
ncbi:uncharacterized protein LOC117107208 [Anneissia japonica]|uniref:uncharacterized protein LOC117107208 n=1 Tax=Anneissia japonica TaxID=1529436 RepID=UPI001425640B|nr:uncharacterized protein LOC117107208 [Anneissia japonica]